MKTETKEKAIVSIFLILFMLVGLIVVLLINKNFIEQPAPIQQPVAKVSMSDDLFAPLEVKVENEIRRQAKEYRVDEAVAVRIGVCESNLDPLAESQTSSAVGVYQFLENSTWGYCEGDIRNYKDSIKCFMEIYPKHPEYWVCK